MAIISGNPTNGNDAIVADRANDIINALAGDDRVNGGGNDALIGNNDILTGGLGSDTLHGGSGIDRVVESGDTTIRLNNTSLRVGNETDTLSGIETATLTGGAGNNLISAFEFTLGSVILNGGAGNDHLNAGSRNDTLNGGIGNDILEDGEGNDLLNGGDGNDLLFGGTGDDELDAGSSGSNTLRGGLGNDTYEVTGFSDTVIENPGGSIFQRFLRNVVTPRFPDGLTVFDASGQFRTSTGAIIREPTKVLILIYPNSPARRAIEEIISLYKTQFQQESVLRVTSVPVRVGF